MLNIAVIVTAICLAIPVATFIPHVGDRPAHAGSDPHGFPDPFDQHTGRDLIRQDSGRAPQPRP